MTVVRCVVAGARAFAGSQRFEVEEGELRLEPGTGRSPGGWTRGWSHLSLHGKGTRLMIRGSDASTHVLATSPGVRRGDTTRVALPSLPRSCGCQLGPSCRSIHRRPSPASPSRSRAASAIRDGGLPRAWGPGGGAMSSIETSVGTAARSVELMARLDRQRFRVPLLAIGSTRNWAVPMMQLDCS